MILQHYYTRARRGLFRNAEGYDSVAKSEGMTDSFIKEYLHPFCFYSPPTKLVQSDSDVSEFPKALFCVHLPDGEMIVGQASYVGADFTGLRNTFFVHNLVVSAAEKIVYVHQPDSILLASNFCCSYDIEQGKIIEALESIDYTLEEHIDPRGTMECFGFTDDIFKQLVDACIYSALSSKKIYIALNVEPEEISSSAISVLRNLIRFLPYEIRNSLGFITYLKEPENKKYLNLMFVDKNSIKLNDSKLKRDYVFDMVGKRVSGLSDTNAGTGMYADFVCANINSDTALWQNFFLFASDFIGEITLSPSVYNDIALFYTAKCNVDFLYSNITCIFEKMSDYLNSDTSGFFEWAAVEELKRFLKSDNYRSNLVVAKGSILLEKCGYNLSYNKYFLERFAIRNNDIGFEALQAAEDAPVFLSVIRLLLEDSSKALALEPYIIKRINSLENITAIFHELTYWMNTEKRLLELSFFTENLYRRFYELIHRSGISIIESCCLGYTAISDFARDEPKLKSYLRQFMQIIDEILLDEGQLIDMSRKEIEEIPAGFLVRNSKHELCMAIEYMQLFLHEFSLDGDKLDRLPDIVREQVIMKIRAIISRDIKPSVFHLVVGLFDRHDEMLLYVCQNNVNLLGDFLIWCLNENVLSVTKDKEVISKCIAKNYEVAVFKERIIGFDRLKPIIKEVKFARLTSIFKR